MPTLQRYTPRLAHLLLSFLFSAFFMLAACSQSAPTRDDDRQVQEDPETIEAARTTAQVKRREHLTSTVQEAAAMDQVMVTGSRMAAPHHAVPPHLFPREQVNRENYAAFDDNPVRLVSEHPVSTFSMDVDTGSYANIRRLLNQGHLPRSDAVRVEEMINYFDYGYAQPDSREQPFSVNTALAFTPWNPDALLLRVGIKGYDVIREDRLPANLVFLVDVSGSMHSPDKLELLKKGLGLLSRELNADDRVSIVVYAGSSGVVLPPTAGDQGATIRAALEQLTAGGSTNGAAGIRLAYDMARQGFIKDGINRVILATDGDFNVGTVNFEQLTDLVERERADGITLTTLGFGGGNYNDHLMEQLADKGNGNYAYIDTIREANKVLVEEMTSTLQVIAGDVKAQIEFNPDIVAEYRLIGYENRVLNREDFNNDKVDAGDIGAGHTVTALYEVVLKHSKARRVDPLRYTDTQGAGEAQLERVVVSSHRTPRELAYLKLRYKLPGETSSRLIETPVMHDNIADIDAADADFRFATAVAAFGQQLRGGTYLEKFGYADILALAHNARGEDRHGYRGEFVSLVELAANLDRRVADK
jgi:Ca-activated chloride channel family protein